MSDPQRPRDKAPPPRATPLQPDQPGSGNRREHPDEQPEPGASRGIADESLELAQKREKDALDNVREGYD